jgi:hypothetical protein
MTRSEDLKITWQLQTTVAREDAERRAELSNLGLLDGRWPVVVMAAGHDPLTGNWLRIRHLGQSEVTARCVARERVKPFRGQAAKEFLAEQDARSEDWADDRAAQSYPHRA